MRVQSQDISVTVEHGVAVVDSPSLLPSLLSVVVLVVPVFRLAELLPLFVEVRAPESAC